MKTLSEMKTFNNTKIFSMIASVVFALVAILQLLRFVLGWTVLVNGFSVPLWASAIAFVIAAGLSIMVVRSCSFALNIDSIYCEN